MPQPENVWNSHDRTCVCGVSLSVSQFGDPVTLGGGQLSCPQPSLESHRCGFSWLTNYGSNESLASRAAPGPRPGILTSTLNMGEESLTAPHSPSGMSYWGRGLSLYFPEAPQHLGKLERTTSPSSASASQSSVSLHPCLSRLLQYILL